MSADDEARRQRDAELITHLRMPKEPFGMAAGSVRTGHDDDSVQHPVWCSPDECTAGAPDFPHHLSAWTIVYPFHGGEAAVFVRLYGDAFESAAELPTVEIAIMRPGQCTSIEGYELRGKQAALLAAALDAHSRVATDPGHFRREVTS